MQSPPRSTADSLGFLTSLTAAAMVGVGLLLLLISHFVDVENLGIRLLFVGLALGHLVGAWMIGFVGRRAQKVKAAQRSQRLQAELAAAPGLSHGPLAPADLVHAVPGVTYDQARAVLDALAAAGHATVQLDADGDPRFTFGPSAADAAPPAAD
ncbi:MAG TPA: hypothetical protein DCZ72_05470 [Armatimonadetes bacterium]|nr:hypothetical protein [Armatimonadota bacterium]